MEQQQFKISFSLGAKLLLSVVTLLLVVIGFLTASTIVTLTEDKRAYTLQSQGTENRLAGVEFSGMSTRVLSLLQLVLASFDPQKPIQEQQERSIRSVLENQSDIFLAEAGRLLGSGTEYSYSPLRKFPAMTRPGEADPSGPAASISEDWWRIALPALLRDGYYFINISRVGQDPLLAVLRADLGYNAGSTSRGIIPVAIGYVPLKSLGAESAGRRVTIANPDGFVLQDTDTGALFAASNLSEDPVFLKARSSQSEQGAGEFRGPDGRYLASFYNTDWQLVVLSRTDWTLAMSAAYTLAEKLALLGLMCITGAVVFATIFAKSLTAPLFALYQATRQVASGDFSLSLKSRSRDEIGALGASFNVMSRKIGELIEESMEKVHLENEMAIASTVQRTLFPPKSHESDRASIRSHYQSASQCGGDWWGFFEVGDKLCMMIADATGHGMPSALITASARSCFSVMHKLAQEDPDFSFSPGAMLAFANRVVNEAASGQIMMTFFVGVADFSSMKLTYASAGHNPPWLLKTANPGKVKLLSLTANGQRVGETRDVEPFQEKQVDITSGDLLFLYTDGLTEGRDSAGEMFGKKRVRKAVEGAAASGPDEVIQTLVSQFASHNTGKELDDDITIAAVRIK